MRRKKHNIVSAKSLWYIVIMTGVLIDVLNEGKIKAKILIALI